MKKLVFLISNAGTGSNLQTVIDAIKKKTLLAKIVAVISDKSDSKGLEIARKENIKTLLVPEKKDLLPQIKPFQPDYILLTGWKQIITDEMINTYPEKILNLHPGIIPVDPHKIEKNPDGTEALWNKGMFTKIAIQNVLSKNATYAGSSIHFLTHKFDFGPILGKTFEKTCPGDTIESLYARLKKKENELYVEVLKKLCNRNS